MSSSAINLSIPIDPLKQTIGIFALVGVGLGLAGSIPILQLGIIAAGSLVPAIMTFAFLIGPTIGVITGLRTGDQRGQTSESYLVSLIGSITGYYVMMAIALLILVISIAIIAGDSSSGSPSGGSFPIGEYIIPIISIGVSTGLTGVGGVYLGRSDRATAEGDSADLSSIDFSPNLSSIHLPRKYIGIGIVIIVVLIAGATIIPGLLSPPPSSQLEIIGNSDTTSDSVSASALVTNPTDEEINTALTVEVITNGDTAAKKQEQIRISASGDITVRIEFALSEMSEPQRSAVSDGNYQIKYIVDGNVIETYDA